MPKVSIIVPVYKVERYLERCIKSILRQSFSDFELILVDDGSPDCSPEICDTYANEDPRIRVIHKENGGLSSARLSGFQIAIGTYILFIDSDDYIEPVMLEKMVLAIETQRAELAICGYFKDINAEDIRPIYLPYSQKNIFGKEEIINKYILPLTGAKKESINIPGFVWIRLHKRDLINEDYFRSEKIFFAEDHVFDLLYSDHVQNIAVINEPLYHYCVNDGSLSTCYRPQKWSMYKNLFNFYFEYLAERKISWDSVRKQTFLLRSVFATVDNGVLSGNYLNFLQERRPVCLDDELHRELRNISYQSLSRTTGLTLLLLRLHAYKMLYKIRRSRLRQTHRKEEII